MKHKVQLSEAAQANQRLTALVNELTLDRDRVVGEMASLKVEMEVKEDELKKEAAGRRKADVADGGDQGLSCGRVQVVGGLRR